MEIHRCSFCDTKIEAGTGKMFVKKDGAVLYFCSRSCEKNLLKLGRNPRDITWVRKKPRAK